MDIDPITVNASVKYQPAKHEIFLSFNDDSDAAMFYAWWNEIGEDVFKAWAAERDDPYGSVVYALESSG